MVTLVVIMTLVIRANAIPSRNSFPLKKIDGSDADQVTREPAFSYQLADFITAACGGIGTHWLHWLLFPLQCTCQAREKPGVGKIWEHLIPSCLFFPCSGKTRVDIWVYETYSFCSGAADGQLGAYNMRLSCSSGASTAGLFPSHICILEVSELWEQQDSWLFWGCEVPASLSVF